MKDRAKIKHFTTPLVIATTALFACTVISEPANASRSQTLVVDNRTVATIFVRNSQIGGTTIEVPPETKRIFEDYLEVGNAKALFYAPCVGPETQQQETSFDVRAGGAKVKKLVVESSMFGKSIMADKVEWSTTCRDLASGDPYYPDWKYCCDSGLGSLWSTEPDGRGSQTTDSNKNCRQFGILSKGPEDIGTSDGCYAISEDHKDGEKWKVCCDTGNGGSEWWGRGENARYEASANNCAFYGHGRKPLKSGGFCGPVPYKHREIYQEYSYCCDRDEGGAEWTIRKTGTKFVSSTSCAQLRD